MIRSYLDWLIELPWAADAPAPIDIAEARRILDDRPLRAREDQAAHPRVSRRAQAQPDGQEPDPLLRRPAGRGQDLARAEHRPARWGASSRASAWAACTTRRRSAAIGAPTSARCRATSSRRLRKAGTRNPRDDARRGRQARRAAFTATRPRRCWKCSTRSRTTPSATTIWTCPSTCPRCCSSRTANVLDTVPGAAARPHGGHRSCPATPQQEKLEIAQRYLVPRAARAQPGCSAEQCTISDAALRAIIDDYTREAGVRNLEREIGNVLRNVRGAHRRRQARDRSGRRRTICRRSSARRNFETEVAMRTRVPGVATGLAWTPVGGDILFVEAAAHARQRAS